MKIKYFDALAGAGKTRALAHHAHRLARAGEKVLFVQPSKLLIDKTITDEIVPLAPRYSIKAIHGGTSPDVVRSIVEHFSTAEAGAGEILFITHEAFMRLPFIQNRKHWTLMFDETPSVDIFEALSVPETHGMISEHLELIEHDAAYAKIVPVQGSHAHLAAMARNVRSDQVWSQFSGLLCRILSPHWDVYVLQSNYRSLQKRDGHAHQLMSYALLRPSIFAGFQDTIIAAALFTDSCLYQLWAAEGVVLEPLGRALHEGLRYQQHQNGCLITIQYVTDAAWSKTLRDRFNAADGQASIKERLPGMVNKAMVGNTFAWMGNKDLAENYFANDRAVRLPNSPHGLNGFQHIHDVVVLSALNAPPAHFHFMETQGMNADALRCAHYRTAVYQAVMRISIRNPHDISPKTITVMDRATALWLADLFPGSQVQALGGEALSVTQGKPGRPRRHASAADRIKACRERKQAAMASISAIKADPTSLVYGTAFASIYDARSDLDLEVADDSTFIQLLRDLHLRVIPAKRDNFLFSPANFDHDLPGIATKRGKDNVRHARGLWLDNDGGDLTHSEFARLFPALRMVVWNTYFSKQERPRWRCFIPTSSAVSADVYRTLIGQIEHTLRQAGYASVQEIMLHPELRLKHHGFDTGKFVASSLFYAPCQAACAGDSFFIDYDDEGRVPLDPQRWIESDLRVVADEVQFDIGETMTTDVPKTASVDSAINRWQKTADGHGHSAFFRLAIDLKKAGLTYSAIHELLNVQAEYARSPRERRPEVAAIMRGMLASTQQHLE